MNRSSATTKRRRSRALPGGRLTAERQLSTLRGRGRLVKPLRNASDLKEGAHGGTRGSPVMNGDRAREPEEVPAR
jgi:hypothetical protein